jgi:uncharacterized protein (DUF2267 family)
MRCISTTLALAASGFVLLAASTASPAASATGTCYKPAEIEADQAMNFQTELMVLSDTCGDQFYRDFTVRNREQILSYQQQLLDYFRRGGAKSPQASLDSFMTRVANEHALRDGSELRQTVCTRSAVIIAEAKTLDREHFRQHAAELAAANEAAYRRCK